MTVQSLVVKMVAAPISRNWPAAARGGRRAEERRETRLVYYGGERAREVARAATPALAAHRKLREPTSTADIWLRSFPAESQSWGSEGKRTPGLTLRGTKQPKLTQKQAHGWPTHAESIAAEVAAARVCEAEDCVTEEKDAYGPRVETDLTTSTIVFLLLDFILLPQQQGNPGERRQKRRLWDAPMPFARKNSSDAAVAASPVCSVRRGVRPSVWQLIR